MTLKELKESLESIDDNAFVGKVAYRAFPVGKAPKLPYICYLSTSTNNFFADNKTYEVIQEVNIELYTAKKSEVTEQMLESKLDELGLGWNKYEQWISSENFYEIIYTINL